jgi:hypothetical protein
VGAAVELPLSPTLRLGFCLSSAQQETAATARFEFPELRSPTGPAILNFSVSGGQLRLLLDAPAAATLRVETSGDLKTWQTAAPSPTPPYPREWSEPLGPTPRFLRAATGP